MTRLVAIAAATTRAWAALRGLAFAPPGTVVQGLGGEVLVVREDGGADEVLPGGYPHAGAASEPLNSRRAA